MPLPAARSASESAHRPRPEEAAVLERHVPDHRHALLRIFLLALGGTYLFIVVVVVVREGVVLGLLAVVGHFLLVPACLRDASFPVAARPCVCVRRSTVLHCARRGDDVCVCAREHQWLHARAHPVCGCARAKCLWGASPLRLSQRMRVARPLKRIHGVVVDTAHVQSIGVLFGRARADRELACCNTLASKQAAQNRPAPAAAILIARGSHLGLIYTAATAAPPLPHLQKQQMAQQPDAAAAAQLARISHGSYGFKGLKDHYEDRVDAKHLGGLGLWFGVYDGHGGEHAADYVQANLGSAVERTIGETIPGFEERLGDARETAKRRKLAEGTSTTGPVLPSVREKEELRAIENAAKEADARIEELRSRRLRVAGARGVAGRAHEQEAVVG